MKKSIKNQQAGFIKIIILIIILLLVMKFSGTTISEVVNWFKNFFGSVLK
jgi:hypothetical protein